MYTYFLRGQPRRALLFCWYHLPNITIFPVQYFMLFHVVKLNLNWVINALNQAFGVLELMTSIVQDCEIWLRS